MMRPLPMIRELFKYLLLRRGLMTITPIEAMAGLRGRADLAHPDVHLALGMLCMDHATLKPHKLPGVMAFAGVAKPKSRGEVRLRSADPADKPVIDHRMLGHPDDLATMVAGVKAMHGIFATRPLADHVVSLLMPEQLPQSGRRMGAAGARRVQRLLPAGRHLPDGRGRSGGGRSVPPGSRHPWLSVADVSIMPVIPDAGMTAPAMMIGEKAADMILQDG